jgi:hypothetical protein
MFLKELRSSTLTIASISKDRILGREIAIASSHEKTEKNFENDSDWEHSESKRLF